MSEAHVASHADLSRLAVVECGGFGFVALNATPPRPDPRRPCCFGASGPLVETVAPYVPPQPAAGQHVFAGSGYGILSAELARYLVQDPSSGRWARILERRLL